MQDAACWYRGYDDKYQVRQLATEVNDNQLLDSWHEDLHITEVFNKSPYHGIGFDDVDYNRRAIRPRHLFTPEEKEEYDKLKKKYGNTRPLDKISEIAASNVKQRNANRNE